ncbi:right-handed parallel beta-helix repeat-containing protein [Paenibacillus eucommiae]|uniref:Right handed beta helix domain-containing protein n=1 Tax=Paenibacillus eucommiae TaxID=1355755 RepID=A0ABS4J6K4_9BACL|nr:right-handed parallel beta-helix repeat-containing protein [Paenibacillus eucommiae]MBP1995447.1 hypothetical protein [Paenibacillus eucommiae]
MKGRIEKLKRTIDNKEIFPITISDAVYVSPEKQLRTKLAEIDAAIIAGGGSSGVDKLNDLTDVDLSVTPMDKQVLLFDQAIAKWRAGTPQSVGVAATSLDELSDVTIGSPGTDDVLTFGSDGQWKAKALPTGVGGASSPTLTYVIENSRWGIVTGVATPPYVTADYIKGDLNLLGIHNAINWAADNGYNYIVLPRGSYMFCYSGRSIEITKSNITIDFNLASAKVIYDSDNKNPFDSKVDGTDYYNYPGPRSGGPGFIIKMLGVTDTHIKNLIMVGDKMDRSFANNGELANEHTYGIMISKGSSYCTVKNCKISSFMGDQITMDSVSDYSMVEFGLGLTVNGIDRATGALIPAAGSTLTTQMFNLPTAGYNVFSVGGQGFTRQTSLFTKEFGVYYYKADNTYLGCYENKKIYTPVQIPSEAKKFRFLFYNETNVNKNMQWTLKFGLAPHHNTIENCELFNIHRGGVTLGGDYNVIQNCVFHDATGVLDRKPGFNDPTRYGINQEDSYGDSCTVRNNLFYNMFTGVLIGCFTVHIHGNYFYNCTSNAINLYSLQNAIVKDNYIYRCATGIGLMSAHLPNANVLIQGNYISNTNNAGNFNGNDSSYHLILRDNMFVDVNNISYEASDDFICERNRFQWSTYFVGVPTLTFDRVQDCAFEAKGIQRDITFKFKEIDNSSVINLKVNLSSRSNTTKGTVQFRKTVFKNSAVNNHIFSNKTRTAIYKDCKFIDTILKYGNINTPTDSAITKVIDSNFYISTLTYLFQAEHNTGFGRTDIERCNIYISNSNFLYLLSFIQQNAHSATLGITNSKVEYTGTGRLNLSYYDNSRKVGLLDFISAHNEFVNINLPSEEAGIYVGYDPQVEGFSEPSSGAWSKPQVYGNANVQAGGYLGWVCIKSGIANKIGWTASTVKTVGSQINVDSNVYQVTIGGTTGSVAPTWTTTQGSIVVDDGVTWTRVGDLAVFKSYGLISE